MGYMKVIARNINDKNRQSSPLKADGVVTLWFAGILARTYPPGSCPDQALDKPEEDHVTGPPPSPICVDIAEH